MHKRNDIRLIEGCRGIIPLPVQGGALAAGDIIQYALCYNGPRNFVSRKSATVNDSPAQDSAAQTSARGDA